MLSLSVCGTLPSRLCAGPGHAFNPQKRQRGSRLEAVVHRIGRHAGRGHGACSAIQSHGLLMRTTLFTLILSCAEGGDSSPPQAILGASGDVWVQVRCTDSLLWGLHRVHLLSDCDDYSAVSVAQRL